MREYGGDDILYAFELLKLKLCSRISLVSKYFLLGFYHFLTTTASILHIYLW